MLRRLLQIESVIRCSSCFTVYTFLFALRVCACYFTAVLVYSDDNVQINERSSNHLSARRTTVYSRRSLIIGPQ